MNNIKFLFLVQANALNRCCSNFKAQHGDVGTPIDFETLKSDVLPCNLVSHKFYNRFVRVQKPLLLEGCAEVCATKPWDFASDIIPSEQGRVWFIADRKSGKFNGM